VKFLKEFALGILAFLLFLSLSIFGLAFMLNQTILNPKFITSELDRLDVSSLVEEVITEQVPEEDLPEELRTALLNTITRIEPLVKEQVGNATDSVYGYLKGKNQRPDLELVLGNTFLNSDFVVSLIEELDVPSLAEELISEQVSTAAFSPEFGTALVNTITELEPSLREQIGTASEPVFAYLLGESSSLDLAFTLRNTILDADFAVALINKLDISPIAAQYIDQQLAGRIPAEMEYLAEYLDEAISELEPTIKEELIAAADPVMDYLLGIRPGLSVTISLEQVMDSLRDTLREAFLESPPPELAELPRGILEDYFDEYFEELTEVVPPAFELDESVLGTAIPTQIAEAIATGEDSLRQARQDIAQAIAEAEEALEQARVYVGYFQLGYYLLIGFMVLLVLGIVLISRQVRDVTRRLGVPLIIYGALEFAAILVGKYFLNKHLTGTWLTRTDIPQSLQTWLLHLSNDILNPLQWFSLGLLIAGIILTVVSFVYKPRQT